MPCTNLKPCLQGSCAYMPLYTLTSIGMQICQGLKKCFWEERMSSSYNVNTQHWNKHKRTGTKVTLSFVLHAWNYKVDIECIKSTWIITNEFSQTAHLGKWNPNQETSSELMKLLFPTKLQGNSPAKVSVDCLWTLLSRLYANFTRGTCHTLFYCWWGFRELPFAGYYNNAVKDTLTCVPSAHTWTQFSWKYT